MIVLIREKTQRIQRKKRNKTSVLSVIKKIWVEIGGLCVFLFILLIDF
jgi:hypothetical protein